MRISYRMSELGLVVLGPKEMTSPKGLRRARGVAGKKSRSFLSRPGSALLATEDAHSLFYWREEVYAGVGGTFKKIPGAPTIRTDLNGDRLTFCTAPPASGFADALFVAGGGLGKLFMVHLSGGPFNWGIAPPLTTLTATVGAAGNLKGVYQYYYTYFSSITGVESNPFPLPVSVTADFQIVNIAALAFSPDLQVTRRRIYRTVGNGAVAFLLVEIGDNFSTTTYVDNTPDTGLQSVELQFDNISPSDAAYDFRECINTLHLGRMWWTRDQKEGHQGRIYYSPAGRAAAVQGFIEPSANDDPIMRIIAWNGSLYGFSKHRILEVVGFDEPFTYRDVTGSLGTEFPWTVVPTPYGILYRSRDDDFRNFNGVISQPLEPGALGDVLKGEVSDTFPAGFNGLYAGFVNDEYWVGDGVSVTLCLYIGRSPELVSWRELGGLGAKALHTTSAGKLGVSGGGKVVVFDDIALVTDAGTAIPWEMEVPMVESDIAMQGILQRVLIEHRTQGQVLTPTLVLHDGTLVALSVLPSSPGRLVTEYALCERARLLALRVTGTLNEKIEIFEIALDFYVPSQEKVPWHSTAGG
jgi:hypothetical protein